MADTMKIGNLDISAFKVGAVDCSIYLGDVKLYPQGEPPTPTFDSKYKFTLSDSSVVSAECDSSAAITTSDTSSYQSTMVSAEIGDCVTTIGENTFQNCSSLTSIEIPSGVTSIGDYAFQNCSSLTSLTVDVNNTVYDSRNNCNAVIETNTNTLIQGCKATLIPNSVTSIGANAFRFCTSLTSIDIPNSVTSIGNSAFNSCSGLTSITIGSGVTSIGIMAFVGCRGLTSIEIPNSVTNIDNYAFNGCGGLTSATIGSGVTSIGNYAFVGCTSLTSVTIEATTPPTLGTNSFVNTNNYPIYVPSASVEDYKTAWSDYASRIQAIS